MTATRTATQTAITLTDREEEAHGLRAAETQCGRMLVHSEPQEFVVTPGDWDEWVEHDPEWRSESGLTLWDSWSQRGEDVEWDEEFECWRIR